MAEPLMQQQVPSPSEESGYAGPDSAQQLDRYIPPGFTVESSGTLLAACVHIAIRFAPVCAESRLLLDGEVAVYIKFMSTNKNELNDGGSALR